MEMSELKCPRDQDPLVLRANSAAAKKCSSCKGLLVDVAHIPSLRKLKHQKILSLKASKLHCPACDSTMREFTYKDMEIDICPNCRSVWLDSGEDSIFNKSQDEKEETKWYENLDPISAFSDSFLSDSNTSCSGGDSGVIDFLGDAVGSLFDGL
tara:strand:- start:990 stop:1451 length:462 start_codon:yes stop_codon:yes gene_type:complete